MDENDCDDDKVHIIEVNLLHKRFNTRKDRKPYIQAADRQGNHREDVHKMKEARENRSDFVMLGSPFVPEFLLKPSG